LLFAYAISMLTRLTDDEVRAEASRLCSLCAVDLLLVRNKYARSSIYAWQHEIDVFREGMLGVVPEVQHPLCKASDLWDRHPSLQP